MEIIAVRRAGRHLLAGFALVALPTITSAQSTTFTSSVMTISKSQAILGTTSALDRLLAQQGAPVSVAAAPVTTLFSTASLASFYTPAADLIVPVIVRGQVAIDRPDVFDSVALPIGWSPLQSRWQRVEHGAPDVPAARFAASLADRDPTAARALSCRCSEWPCVPPSDVSSFRMSCPSATTVPGPGRYRTGSA